MSIIILVCGLVLMSLLIAIKNDVIKNVSFRDVRGKKRLDRILKFVRLAPFLAIVVIGILIVTYLKTKYYIRLSHAWLVVQFWMLSAIYYYLFMISNRKSKLSIIGLVLSFAIAFYITPLNHYESVFNHIYTLIPNIFALIMLSISYIIIGDLLNTDTKEKNKT
ncbi:hypothetical protein [Neobacillus massiliamazoniensis]|uniref:Uncharacterized protein n=1 Tax=Neobacillus massiliamazoniensis TaxID=1499688 RepID=A0A0U1P3I6_9BACI|nr:hypothetical protein [Neobacillus massiliamazoniensis]CRK84816.1 hypothetical protein BN000_04866 [Neobacillus massiliamazoniensis]